MNRRAERAEGCSSEYQSARQPRDEEHGSGEQAVIMAYHRREASASRARYSKSAFADISCGCPRGMASALDDGKPSFSQDCIKRKRHRSPSYLVFNTP